MSKIFKISGDFKKGGGWAKPDPYFTGEILVDGRGLFYGYCHEEEGVKYLVGAITEKEDGGQDVQFYILSNNSKEQPVFYNTHGDGATLKGRWHKMEHQLKSNHMCTFVAKTEAKVTLEKQPYSEKTKSRIDTNFSEVKTGIIINGKIIDSILCP